MAPRVPVAKSSSLMTVKNLTQDSADLYIYGEIVDNTEWKWDESDVMPDDVLKALNQVNGLKNLNIYINSPGGSVFAGLAIYNMLKRNSAYKTVYVDGVAASMASVIALVGDKVIIPTNAFLMIHKPWTIAIGDSNDFRKVADDLEAIEEGVLNVYKDNMKEGADFEEVRKMVQVETWLTGDKAAEYFNIEVSEPVTMAACQKEALSLYDKTPEELIKSKTVDAPVAKDKDEFLDIELIKMQNELDLLTI
nr:head maturation protease, ClpP-related [Jeotgalibacillus malaysiensis]